MLELAQHQGEGPEVQRVLHVRDVTHQVEVDRIKSEFLSMAAHELRTPMTSIYGFTELMLLRPLTPERQREALQKIHRQSEAMIGILNELLDLSRLEARRGQDFRFESLPAQAVVQEAVQDFSPPESREPPLLELAEAALPVHVDRGKLQQVMRNLLSNAYKYSPQGGRVWVRLRAEEDEQVLIEVQDQGIGMSAEELAHVSERFYRADKSGSIPGTGLGMSIVKEILELMSGSLRLSSAPGQGTTVQVRLPTAAGLSPASLDG
jgi:signal transduction histidine kinase